MVGVLVVGVVVPSAHHGHDVAVVVIDHRHAGFKAVLVELVELVLHRCLGCLLHARLDGGLNGEAARENLVVVELIREQGAHVVDEVGVGVDIHARARGLGYVELEFLGLRGVMLLLRNVAVAEHAVEYRIAALDGELGVDGGVVLRRGIRQAHEQGRLGQG